MLVLGIESSCDETGVALYHTERGLLAEDLYSQIDMHKRYGGVVPELASRDHVIKLLPMIEQLLKSASIKPSDLDGIAYTSGPGLVGALMVGATIAQTLAEVWQVPALGVHHMEGHLLAPLLEKNPPKPPFVALLVSGGHTQLIAVKALGDYELMGDTLDDAAGEAFDKAAKMMGLPYPGGPSISAMAKEGDRSRLVFPKPMTDRPGLDFSFSGLKTFTLNAVNKMSQGGVLADQDKKDIAAAFEDAVAQTLVIKCRRALQKSGMSRLVLAGGVAANTHLRELMEGMVKKTSAQLFFPSLSFCTDNGAMIALVGALRLKQGEHSTSIDVQPRRALQELSTITTEFQGSYE